MPTPEELNRAGLEHYKAGRYAEAAEAFRAAVAAAESYPPGWVNLALALIKIGKHDDAIRAAQRAVELVPRYGGAHYQLGNAFAAKGRWNEAVHEYLRAWELDPTQLNAPVLAGHLLLDHGMSEKALDIWKRYLAAAPPDHPKRAEVEAEIARASARPPAISKFEF
jgi:tetratricopeptide (TPR) repeat protein